MKKIIIGLLLFFFSTITYLLVGSAILNSQFTKTIEEYIENDEYEKAYAFLNSIYNPNVIYEEDKDNVVVQLYNALGNYHILTETNEYISLEESIDVAVFNLPKNINLTKDCYVEVSFEGVDSTYIKTLEYTSSAIVTAQSFDFLSFSLFEIDMLNDLDLEVLPNITNIKFYDSNDAQLFDINQTIEVTPNSFFTATVNEFVYDYNYYQSGKFDSDLKDTYDDTNIVSEKSLEEQNRIFDILEEILEEENYSINEFKNEMITERSGFVIQTILLMSAIFVIDGVVIYFVYIKNRTKKTSMPIVKLPVNK